MPQSHTSDRVADIVARTLYAHMVRHAFGVPGGEIVALIDALEAVGIPFHLARHETSAAIWPPAQARSAEIPNFW